MGTSSPPASTPGDPAGELSLIDVSIKRLLPVQSPAWTLVKCPPNHGNYKDLTLTPAMQYQDAPPPALGVRLDFSSGQALGLDMAPAVSDQVVTTPATISTDSPGAKVWVLDDDTSLCKLLTRQFKACGWLPLATHTAADFDRLLADVYPDLLVLDQMLPDRTGTQILTGLRKAGHQFPVLMLSALGAPDDRIHGLEVGADDYLSKPFTAKELMLRIERLLGQVVPGSGVLDPSQDCFQIADVLFNPSELSLSCADERLSLSRGEAVLLSKFCQSPSLILSREQLARGSGSIVDVSTSRSLDMRVSKLRRQLSSLYPGLGDHLESVRGRGYRLMAEIIRLTPTH